MGQINSPTYKMNNVIQKKRLYFWEKYFNLTLSQDK